MKMRIGLAVCWVAFWGAGAAIADAPRTKPAPKVVSQRHQPTGKPPKASSFAPHPTDRRVFGTPIQPPIIPAAAPERPQSH